MARKMQSPKKSRFKKESSLPIILILLAIAAVILFVNIKPNQEDEIYTSTQLEQAVNSSTLQVPSTTFRTTLENGKAEFSDEDANGYIMMSAPYFSIETSEGYDTFAVMNFNTGGSGEFVAIALFHTLENSTVYANSFDLGDRVTVENIEKISGNKDVYEIRVDYLDKEENAPLVAEPTLKKSVTLQVDTHKITTQPQQ
jgi:hypothetical protein